MAKQQQRPEKELNRRQQATRKRDEKAQHIIMWIAIGIGALILLVLGFGIVSELVLKANAPVARVDGAPIRTRDYQARVRFERLSTQNQILQYQSYLTQFDTSDPMMQSFVEQLQQQQQQLQTQLMPGLATVFGGGVLDQMIEEELVRLEAARLGFSVTEEEIERQIEQLFGYDRDAVAAATTPITGTATPMTRDEYLGYLDQFRGSYLRTSGLSEAAFRQSVKSDLLRPKVVEALTQDVDTQALQVEVTLLMTRTLEGAAALQARLNAGADVDALLEELNADDVDASVAFTMPWSTPGRFVAEFGQGVENAAFETPVGTASDPIAATAPEDTYYVVFVRGREVRELDTLTVQQVREQRFKEWLTQQITARVTYLDWEKVTPDNP